MSALADFRTWQDERIQDDASYLTQAEKDDAIDQAALTYSKHSPREIVYDITGDGGYDYAPPPGWITGFSELLTVEQNPDDNQNPEEGLLDRERFHVYDAPTGERLRFVDLTPTTSDTMRVRYSMLHTLDAAGSTIPGIDELAVADLAASYALRQLAARFAQASDTTMSADVADFGGRVQMYTALSDRLLRQYRDHVGVGTGEDAGEAPAVVFRDFDDNLSAGSAGWGRLFHDGGAY